MYNYICKLSVNKFGRVVKEEGTTRFWVPCSLPRLLEGSRIRQNCQIPCDLDISKYEENKIHLQPQKTLFCRIQKSK